VAVKTGVFEGMSTAEYESIPALRWSRLKAYLRSPAHGKAAESRFDGSDDYDFGQAVHTSVLEPGTWEERFGVFPEARRGGSPSMLRTRGGRS
jgi:hypothetical protein